MASSDIIKINVHLNLQGKQSLVGELADSEGQIYFEYAQTFVDSKLEISPFKLPLSQQLFNNVSRSELYGLPGVFYDSLPDGWGLLVMDRVFRNKGIDPGRLSPLTRLAYLGDRAIGALQYEPESDAFEHNKHLSLDLLELSRESQLILEGETEQVIKEIVLAGGSPGGARPKALIGLNEKNAEAIYGVYDIPKGFQHYVVKFKGYKEPDTIGIVEYVYSLMAKKAGINMPETRLLRGGKDYFFSIKRFDRVGNEKIHSHTLAGLLHSDFRKPELSYDHLLKVTSHLTRNQQDVIEAYRRMVFNVLAFNRDDHAKNFSFIMHKDGQWSLSPAYDLVYSEGVAGWHTMDISGRMHPKQEDIIKLGSAHGIKKNKAQDIFNQVQEAVSEWESLAQQYEVESAVIKNISKAMKELRQSL